MAYLGKNRWKEKMTMKTIRKNGSTTHLVLESGSPLGLTNLGLSATPLPSHSPSKHATPLPRLPFHLPTNPSKPRQIYSKSASTCPLSDDLQIFQAMTWKSSSIE